MANLRGQKPPATPKFRPEPDELVRTFQMRLRGAHPSLDDAADRYQRAKRAVYAKASRTGRSFDALKSETCAAFDLPARMFNAIRLDLRGQEKARYDTAQTEDRIEKLDLDRARLERKLAEPDLSNTQKRRARRDLHRKRESRERNLAQVERLRGIPEAE